MQVDLRATIIFTRRADQKCKKIQKSSLMSSDWQPSKLMSKCNAKTICPLRTYLARFSAKNQRIEDKYPRNFKYNSLSLLWSQYFEKVRS